jgi:hypothetical protein
VSNLLYHLGLRADEATLFVITGAVALATMLDSCQG